MEEQLFLFEVLIEDIFFEDVSGEIPTKKQLVITVTLGNIVTLEIRSETLPLKGGEGSNKRHIEFKCGKSYLCFFSPDNLLDALESKPIEIVVGIKGDVQPMSSSTCPWHDCFKEMVAESKDIVGFLTPASIADNFTLVNNDARKGNIQMFLRLSCFGKSLQTQYEFNTKSGNREFVFKSPYMMTTFMCTKYGVGDSSDFLPISPMYTITNINADKATPSDQSVSWTAIPKPTHDLSFRSSVQSECMFPEYLTSAPPAKSSTLTFDIVSLCDRPEEDKFIDFNTGRRISDVHDQHEKSTIHSDDSDGKDTIIFFTDSRPTNVERKVDITASPSTEKLSKACQCPKTPIICQHVLDAIKRYQKSHPDLMIHGKKVKYEKLLKNSNGEKKEKKDSTLRLRGGKDEENIPPFKHKKGKGCYSRQCKMAKQLRSVGISQLAEMTRESIHNEQNYFCADFFCPESTKQNLAIQVNFSEDEIPFHFSCQNKHCPAAKMFKKFGLGPLSTEKCQGTIYGPVTPPIQYGISQTYGIFDTYGPFGIFSTTDTPFLPDFKEHTNVNGCFQNALQEVHETEKKEKVRCKECYTKTAKKELNSAVSTENNIVEQDSREVLRLRGGVASERIYVLPSRLRAGAPSKSPIAECQEVMEQFDKILEEYRNALQPRGHDFSDRFQEYMPFSKTGNCGHARCTYISEPILPPIHWDCPDPLPLGFCQNPECPYLPQDLKRFGRILSAKRRRDASDSSSMESQCHNLRYNCDKPPECITADKELYTFQSNCPFSNPPKIVNMMQFDNSYAQQCYGSSPNYSSSAFRRSISEPCSNPECPLRQQEILQSCSNPDCPLKLLELTNSCSNPDCPLKQRELSEPCSNPDCTLKDYSLVESSSYLECPLKKRQISKQCSNPECPYRQVSEESCQNPDCPLKMQFFSSSRETYENFESLIPGNCENPECPFKTKILLGNCNATSASECSNPNCLIHKQSCSNPDCPLKQLEICANPKCPYKSQQATKNKGICGPSSQSICGDTTCPFNIEADGDKMGDKQDQLTSDKGKDGSGDKKQTEEKYFDQTQLEKDNWEQGSPVTTKGDRPSHYDMAPCTTKTCEFMGGKLPCVDCATITKVKKISIKVCPGAMKCPAGGRHSSHVRKSQTPESAKRALKKERKKFVYHFGDTYPGTHVGHKECVVTPFNVPAKMGWLWNVHTPCLRMKRRNGWRPGLIGRTILEVIQAHRKAQNMALLEQGKKKRKNKYGFVESETEIIHPKPTLQIKKREGIYYITMNPLKDPRTLVNNENPYMECTPMQFKIIKNKDSNAYKSCICNDQGLLYEQSSSSDSELDLEFTPPAGVIRPERFIRPRDVIHTDTQYNAKDFALPVEKTKSEMERGSSEEKSRDKGKKIKQKRGKGKKK